MQRLAGLTIRYMWKNRRRTMTTVVGVILSTILLFLLFEVTYSVLYSGDMYDKLAFYGGEDIIFRVDGETALRMREDMKKAESDSGEKVLAGISIQSMNLQITDVHGIRMLDDFSEMAVPIETISGRLPENASEVLLNDDTYLAERLGIRRHFRIGDEIEISEMYRLSDIYYTDYSEQLYREGRDPEDPAEQEELERLFETKDRRVIIVGRKKESAEIDGSSLIAILTDEMIRNSASPTSVRILLEDSSSGSVSKAAECIADHYGLDMECCGYIDPEEEQKDWLIIDALLLLIAFVFAALLMVIIRNAFNISVDERLMDYGILRCIGITRKQIFRMLLLESLIVTVLGAILGILAGFGIAALGLKIASEQEIIQELFGTGFKLEVFFSWRAILITLGIVFLTTSVAMVSPVEKLFRMSPIDAQKKREKVRRPGKRSLVEWGAKKKLLSIETAYGVKSAVRTRGRFVRTVIIYSFGLALVIGIASAIKTATATEYNLLHEYNYMGYIYPEKQESTELCLNPEDWTKSLSEFRSSACCRGVEGVLGYYEMRMDPGVTGVISVHGVTEGIWNALSEDMTELKEVEGEGVVPVVRVVSDLGRKPEYSPGDTFQVKYSDATFEVIGSISDRAVGNVLRINAEDHLTAGETEKGDYLYLARPEETVFKNVMAERMDDRPEEELIHFFDAEIDGVLSVEAAPEKKAELWQLVESTLRNPVKLENNMAYFRLARNVILAVLGFMLLISVINAVNIERGQMDARKDEMYILRVIGLTKKQKRKMLMAENLAAAVIASGLGILFGILATKVIIGYFYQGNGLLGSFDPDTMKVRFRLDWVVIFISAGALLFTGFLTAVLSRDGKKDELDGSFF